MASNDSSIIGGSNNSLTGCRYCTIIGGKDNEMSNKFNTHFIGSVSSNFSSTIQDNAFYVDALGGTFVDGDIVYDFSLSDQKLKDNVRELEDCEKKINSITPVSFTWSDKQKTFKGMDIGVIAQQVEQVAPELIYYRKDGFLSVKYEKLTTLILGAIKEQSAKLDLLEKRLDL